MGQRGWRDPARIAVPRPGEAPTVTRSIHVVDHDDAIRASLQALLSVRFQCIVRGFRSGSSFLDEMEDVDPGVLLIDVHPPGANGIDILKAIAPYGSKFVPLVMTGQASVSVAVQAMKANASDFLEKPCEPGKVIDAVDVALCRFDHHKAAAERKRSAQANIAKLSSRESDVLKGLIDGRPNKQIAHELSISPRTVEIYRANLMDKLEVRSLSEVLRIAFAAGLFPEG